MKNRMITKYFSICAAVIFSSIICIGTVIAITVVNVYKNDIKDSLSETASVISGNIERCINENDLKTEEGIAALDKETEYLDVIPDYDMSVVEAATGKCLVSTNDEQLYKMLSNSVIQNIPSEGSFSSGSTLEDFFGTRVFSFSLPVYTEKGEFFVIIYTATDDYNNLVTDIIKTFVFVFAISAAITFVILYFVTRDMMRPVSDMMKAAERFGKGDFSEKLKITDSDEFGELAAAMNNMAKSLEGLESSRKSFVANVSHELKTPMTSIGGFVDGILDGTIPPEMHKQYLTIVSEEINRLSRMVRSMLNISKYESGEIKMKQEEFDITELTIKTVFLFEKRITDRPVDVLGLDSPPHYIIADSDLVQQIIYNLIENAIKFVDIGGYIAFSFTKEGGKTYVAVRNSGGGLTEEEIPRVFERFYKTDESHGKDKTGVGLGLAIVRSIVNLHDGHIIVKSKPGEYTEFSFGLKTSNRKQDRKSRQKGEEDGL